MGDRPVAVYHLTVVFEKGDIVDRCLNAKGNALLVIHFNSGPSHMVFDACTLDTGLEVIAEFVQVSFGDFAAKEGSNMVRFDGMDGSTYQFLVDGSKVFLPLEDDIGGVFSLHDAPVIARGKVTQDGAILSNDLIKLPVQAVWANGGSQLLGAFRLVHIDKGVVQHGIADPFSLQFSCQFVMPVIVELKTEGCPSWHSQIA